MPQSSLCFTVTHRSYSWCDGMGYHCLQYMVTPSIDPWHHDSPAVCPYPETTCVATDVMAPRSHFSRRKCSASHDKGVTRLSPHCYNPYLACPILRFVSNGAYLGSFGRRFGHHTILNELEARLQQIWNEMS
ncbi:uncharacterized protein TNCV_2361961 [Trichonephila clavipes]|nr:uncharacterized protein TNCV_2361961 [Trichonephila clavipes]